MSNQKPTAPYIYQPSPPQKDGRHFAISGPGTEKYQHLRLTREEAEALLLKFNTSDIQHT